MHGLRKFIDFCVDFDDLVHRDEHFPLLRASMWSHWSYWFRRLDSGRDFREFLGETITCFADNSDGRGSDNEREVKAILVRIDRLLGSPLQGLI